MPLPPGFRFHPTDVELIKFYLKRKVMGRRILFDVIAEVDIYKFAPWDLPDKSSLRTRDLEWYFFVPRERKYANGARSNRATDFGYWKATGKDRPVLHNEKTAGMIKTLIFHEGRPPRGNRTDWVMHEFRLEDKDLAESGVPLDSYVLCKIFKKDGPGPKTGAQYGAPFNEEEWDDDVEVAAASLFPSLCQSGPASVHQDNPNIGSSLFVPGTVVGGSSSGSGPSKSVSLTNVPPPNGNDENFLGLEPPLIPGDDILSLWDIFFDDNTALPDQIGENVQPDKVIETIAEGTPLLQPNDIYDGLHDLNVLNGNEQNFASSALGPDIVLGEMLPMDGSYLELNDLTVPQSTDGYGSHDVPAYASTSQNYSEDLCCCQLCNGYGFQHFPPATVSHLPQGTLVGNGNHGRDGYEANSGAAELGGMQYCEAQTRGEQRTNYSRLQNLLESIPARPASGREASGNYFFSPYGGSAIHVKVTQCCGYTEHALSDVWGKYGYLIGYEPNQGREKLRKGMAAAAASQDSGFSFVCLLGRIVWIVLATVVINLDRYGLNVMIQSYKYYESWRKTLILILLLLILLVSDWVNMAVVCAEAQKIDLIPIIRFRSWSLRCDTHIRGTHLVIFHKSVRFFVCLVFFVG